MKDFHYPTRFTQVPEYSSFGSLSKFYAELGRLVPCGCMH